jgi:Rieske Fe-S protein
MSDPIGHSDQDAVQSLDPTQPPITRRRFLVWAAGVSLGASALFIGATVIKAMVPPDRSIDGRKNAGRVAVARLSDLQINEPLLAEYGQEAVFVVKTPGAKVLVFGATCPHMGCTLAFVKASDKFVCPCHKSAFALDGRRLAGPAPRGMISAASEIVNGEVIVSGFRA